MRNRSGPSLLAWLSLLVCMGILGCAGAPSERVVPASSIQQALIGKTKHELMNCTSSPPVEERTVGDVVVLRYYQEASVLEESFAASKSSVPRVHHGCWATLGLKNDRVDGVQYDSVPPFYQDEEHCDDIFENCVGK